MLHPVGNIDASDYFFNFNWAPANANSCYTEFGAPYSCNNAETARALNLLNESYLLDAFGRIDILAANAGIYPMVRIADWSRRMKRSPLSAPIG